MCISRFDCSYLFNNFWLSLAQNKAPPKRRPRPTRLFLAADFRFLTGEQSLDVLPVLADQRHAKNAELTMVWLVAPCISAANKGAAAAATSAAMRSSARHRPPAARCQ